MAQAGFSFNEGGHGEFQAAVFYLLLWSTEEIAPSSLL